MAWGTIPNMSISPRSTPVKTQKPTAKRSPPKEAAAKMAAALAAQPPQSAEAKIAMGWLHTAKFLTTAPELKHLPVYEYPEIAFVGRSNAGKSTCINTL